MSRRLIIILTVSILAVAALVAVAAVVTPDVPTVTATPRVHRVGADGWFSVIVTLPKQTSPAVGTYSVSVEEGDVWLTAAQGGVPAAVKEDTDDEASAAPPPPAAGQVTITGRCGAAGLVRLMLLGRTADGMKPLARVRFALPAGNSDNPDVRTSWARMQQAALAGADVNGEESYSQYWDLAIAPRYGLQPRLNEAVTRWRREPPDLYSVFTGAAAIQESLQLEQLGTDRRGAATSPATASASPVALASLVGPTVKSHPFHEMLKERAPVLPELSSLVPADQYGVFFSNIAKQIELADLMDEWGGNLLHQAQAEARDFKVRGKISRQLCLENSWLARMFGDRVIGSMAFTGSDPFLKEGTAFTAIFTLKDKERFRKQMEKNYAAAAEQGAKRSTFAVNRTTGFSAVSPDRSISSYTLIMGSTAVVSTSLPALQRIAECAAGRIPALAGADDFRYMRTIFPQDAAEEDIFIYLSDAHIRNLVGPRAKIGEARRMRCSANLGMLANARLWFRAEQRREPTMQELVDGGYLGQAPPECPDHGRYSFVRDGHPSCSLHNRPGLLTPVAEVPLEQVTPQEAAQYKAFVENYNRYWTRFFDPIGIRVKMGKDIRIQTCILPLIENSWYDGLAAFSGRTPGELTESSVLPRTIISLRGHMDKRWLEELRLPRGRSFDLNWLGNEMALNLCDGQVLFSTGGGAMGLMGREIGRSSLEPIIIGYLGSALNLPTYLTVKVTDPAAAERAIPGLFRTLAPGRGRSDDLSVETYSIEEFKGKPLYVANFNLWFLKLRLYTAVVGDRLVVASRRDIVTDLLAGSANGAKGVTRNEGNMELSVYRSAFKQLEDTVNLGWQEDLRHACHRNLPLAAVLLKALGLPADQLESTVAGLRGYQPYCPSGGRYVVDKIGSVACTTHGTAVAPRQPKETESGSKTLQLVNSLERVNARLAFTPEGLMTTVDIRRK